MRTSEIRIIIQIRFINYSSSLFITNIFLMAQISYTSLFRMRIASLFQDISTINVTEIGFFVHVEYTSFRAQWIQ